MLKSYEAIYENGQVKWLGEKPEVESARIIVTVLEETQLPLKRRRPPQLLEKVRRWAILSVRSSRKRIGNVCSDRDGLTG
ncbi:hypothetical protein [Lyngbya sp. CCY1209]|jgi:hypothetical protein|uniref:hypothetical protein n=1 Tax=Lyngbya sp. CCY1209 TaxID=2886103 RepID=UPI002D1FDE43|nr:hypothetical protein [Lyngbya sp. CCY1209]MEB3884714.1 hypothetical protein [Lyngbya sp. CCY1209]